MKSIDKSLCKLKKDQIEAVLPLLAAEVSQSRYICRRCARVAKSKKWLCKPESIEKINRLHQAAASVPAPTLDRHQELES